MNKNKKGISLIVLVTTVIVIVIIVTTVSITGISVSNNFKKQEFALELSYIQEAVNNYKDANNNEYPLLSNSYSINTASSSVKNQFELEKTDSTGKITLYEIDMQKLGNIETVYGKKSTSTDAYALSLDTGIVYYIDGVKVGGKLYYTLNNELKKLINYSGTFGNAENLDGIIFMPSTTTWTNEKVITDVYIPKDYTSISVLVDGSIVSTYSTEESYIKYSISQTAKNYSIAVNYVKNGENYTQTYYVSNVDTKAPTFEVSDIKIMDSQNSQNKFNYMTVSASDDLSGIKYIKYENENIASEDAVVYFKSNGTLVQDDIIEVKEGVKNITVYVEDNAGNYVIKNITNINI